MCGRQVTNFKNPARIQELKLKAGRCVSIPMEDWYDRRLPRHRFEFWKFLPATHFTFSTKIWYCKYKITKIVFSTLIKSGKKCIYNIYICRIFYESALIYAFFVFYNYNFIFSNNDLFLTAWKHNLQLTINSSADADKICALP